MDTKLLLIQEIKSIYLNCDMKFFWILESIKNINCGRTLYCRNRKILFHVQKLISFNSSSHLVWIENEYVYWVVYFSPTHRTCYAKCTQREQEARRMKSKETKRKEKIISLTKYYDVKFGVHSKTSESVLIRQMCALQLRFVRVYLIFWTVQNGTENVFCHSRGLE